MILEQLIDCMTAHLTKQGHNLQICIKPEERGWLFTLYPVAGAYEASRFYTDLDIQNAQPVTVASATNHMVSTITQKVLDASLGEGVINVQS